MKAFTFIEVMLVTSLTVIVGGAIIWFSSNFYFEREMLFTKGLLQEKLNQAQLYALAGKNDTAWGVAYRGSTIILFSGDTYETRAAQWDESWVLTKGISLSGFDQIVFQRNTGTTHATNFTLRGPSQTLSASLNREGTLEYE